MSREVEGWPQLAKSTDGLVGWSRGGVLLFWYIEHMTLLPSFSPVEIAVYSTVQILCVHISNSPFSLILPEIVIFKIDPYYVPMLCRAEQRPGQQRVWEVPHWHSAMPSSEALVLQNDALGDNQ